MFYLWRNVRNPLDHVQASFEIKQTFLTEFQPYPEVDILDIRNAMVRYHLQKPESQIAEPATFEPFSHSRHQAVNLVPPGAT
jgi:hypothetical protein